MINVEQLRAVLFARSRGFDVARFTKENELVIRRMDGKLTTMNGKPVDARQTRLGLIVPAGRRRQR